MLARGSLIPSCVWSVFHLSRTCAPFEMFGLLTWIRQMWSVERQLGLLLLGIRQAFVNSSPWHRIRSFRLMIHRWMKLKDALEW